MNKTVLITGASSGIGMELAKLFAKDRYNLVLVARRAAELLKLSDELTKKHSIICTVIPKDLSLPSAPEEIFAELNERSICIDVLVNNAGTQVYGNYQATDIEKEMGMVHVNLTALTHLTKLAIPGMVRAGRGKILNVASIASFGPGPLNAVYCATKAYVLSYSEAIAKDLEGTGITVTALCPGPTRSEFAQKANIEKTRLFRFMAMSSDRVATIGYKALMKGKRTVVAGIRNKLLVNSIRFTPRTIVLNLSKWLMSSK